MKKQPEFELQKSICKWISLQYPNLLFLSDTVASVKLTKPQAGRNKAIQKDGFKTPDLIIFQKNEKYNALFIELKIESPFKKDGLLKSDGHLDGQFISIEKLKERGYYACFSWSFEMTKEIIEKYLKNNL